MRKRDLRVRVLLLPALAIFFSLQAIDPSSEYGFAESPRAVDHPSTSSRSLLSQQGRGLNERGGGGRAPISSAGTASDHSIENQLRQARGQEEADLEELSTA